MYLKGKDKLHHIIENDVNKDKIYHVKMVIFLSFEKKILLIRTIIVKYDEQPSCVIFENGKVDQ